MSKVRILDCTLRDGGYCNQWKFGFENIQKIAGGLVESGVDIIECGFLTEYENYSKNISKYNTMDQADRVIPDNRRKKEFVVMANYGEFDFQNLPESGDTSVDGIRLAFHKKDLEHALLSGRIIQNKGYELFLQPMVSLNYSDPEFLELIQKSNEVMPSAFYIVDSFGIMSRKDLMRLFYMVDHNLADDIAVGFHSHNNMQLAYSNAQALLEVNPVHDVIIDASIYGMGRGAGNLNTELFLGYLNENYGGHYSIKPLLNIIDQILDAFCKRAYWGYSLPNYLSASYNTHPNYAAYLSEKNALTIKEMDEILSIMDDEKRIYFDKGYIEDLYFKYLSTGNKIKENRSGLIAELDGRDVLLIAPGPGSSEGRNRIDVFRKENDVVTLSINFHYSDADYIFVSNLRRFREIVPGLKDRCIVTSNIPQDNVYLQTDYAALLNDHEMVQDNAGLMAIAFMIKCGVKHIYLAGYDGYSHDSGNNYRDNSMVLVTRNAILDSMNEGMRDVLDEYRKQCDIEFLVEPKNLLTGSKEDILYISQN